MSNQSTSPITSEAEYRVRRTPEDQAELIEARQILKDIAAWRDDLASIPVPPGTETDVWIWTTNEIAEFLTDLLNGEGP